MNENYVEWEDRLSVGIEKIDLQHQTLIGFTNELNDNALFRGY